MDVPPENGLSLVAVEGNEAPGAGPGELFSFFVEPLLLEDGSVSFMGRYDGFRFGIWSNRSGALGGEFVGSTLIPEVDPVLEAGGLDYLFSVNDSGQMAYQTSTYDPATPVGREQVVLVKNPDATHRVIARQFTAPPDLAPGIVYGETRVDDFTEGIFLGLNMNDAGQVAFLAFLDGPGVTLANDFALFTETGADGLRLMVRTGDAAPGAPIPGHTDAIDEEIGDIAPMIWDGEHIPMSASGDIAFRARVRSAGTPIETREVIYAGASRDTLRIVARTGDAAPGMAPGVVFDQIQRDPFPGPGGEVMIDELGHVGFMATVAGPGVEDGTKGLWVESAIGQLELVARTGESLPGLPQGVVVEDFPYDHSLVMNGDGDLAFKAELSGSLVGHSNDQAIWAQGSDGSLVLVFREGDTYDFDDDPVAEDLRRPSDFFFNKTGSFNKNHELAFLLVMRPGGFDVQRVPVIATVDPQPTITCEADINGDAFVDFSDFLVLAAQFGSDGTSGCPCSADIDGDGDVDFGDFLALASEFGLEGCNR